MFKNYRPVIVVVAFERSKSLKRILSSLDISCCNKDTKLIISIDNNGKNKNVVDIANDFEWKNGDKEVIYHKERLGLRNHILACGDLSLKYGSVILLEDDLFVSPFFYEYATEALNFYDDCEKIGGISLYNLPYTESSKLPFIPIKDDSDVYFKQIPSSLGQAWSAKHWSEFMEWYAKDPDIQNTNGLPYIVKKYWPESSWKRYYYAYLIESDKYFVFPQTSYSTNFSDQGTNMVTKSFFRQTQLNLFKTPVKFKKLRDSKNVYDAYSEIKPDILNCLNKLSWDHDIEVDLYGKKESFTKDYVLTSKPCKKVIASFGRHMKPHEMNIIFNYPGNDFFLAKAEDVLAYPGPNHEINFNNRIEDFVNEYSYFYINPFDIRILIKLIRYRIVKRIKSIFRN